jgi:hypothetical protein
MYFVNIFNTLKDNFTLDTGCRESETIMNIMPNPKNPKIHIITMLPAKIACSANIATAQKASVNKP